MLPGCPLDHVIDHGFLALADDVLLSLFQMELHTEILISRLCKVLPAQHYCTTTIPTVQLD